MKPFTSFVCFSVILSSSKVSHWSLSSSINGFSTRSIDSLTSSGSSPDSSSSISFLICFAIFRLIPFILVKSLIVILPIASTELIPFSLSKPDILLSMLFISLKTSSFWVFFVFLSTTTSSSKRSSSTSMILDSYPCILSSNIVALSMNSSSSKKDSFDFSSTASHS